MDRTDKAGSGDKVEGSERIAYRVKDAREVIGIRRSKFYDLLAKKEIESIRIDKKTILVPRQALVEWMERKRKQQGESGGSA